MLTSSSEIWRYRGRRYIPRVDCDVDKRLLVMLLRTQSLVCEIRRWLVEGAMRLKFLDVVARDVDDDRKRSC